MSESEANKTCTCNPDDDDDDDTLLAISDWVQNIITLAFHLFSPSKKEKVYDEHMERSCKKHMMMAATCMLL